MFLKFYSFAYIWVFYLNVCLCTSYMQGPQRPEEGVKFYWTKVTDKYKGFVGAGQ